MPGMSNRDTMAKALEIISQHGENAERIAAESYVNCFYEGEFSEAVVWKAVRNAIREIQFTDKSTHSWLH